MIAALARGIPLSWPPPHKYELVAGKYFPHGGHPFSEVVAQNRQARESTTQQFLLEMRSGAWPESVGLLAGLRITMYPRLHANTHESLTRMALDGALLAIVVPRRFMPARCNIPS